MLNIAGEADFLQCDITYDDCKNSIPMFNAVAFAMEWVTLQGIVTDWSVAVIRGLK